MTTATPIADIAAIADMADLPVQHPRAPANAAQARARFFNSGNAFNVKLPPVPARRFDEVAAQALAATRSGWFDCDQSAALGSPVGATTPLMRARYARVAPDAPLLVDEAATGLIVYVLAGQALCQTAADGMDAPLRLGAGDVLLLPGGTCHQLHACGEGAWLWVVDNRPQLALEGAIPPLPRHAMVDLVHFPAAEIARQLELVCRAGRNASTSGHALVFSSERQEAGRNLMPSLTLSLNTLPPGADQPPHRHNSAAITLVVQGENCHSVVDGQRVDWTPWTTVVTPPGAPHSHHNADRTRRALFLIVQDGGLHYQARTMGFEFLGGQAEA